MSADGTYRAVDLFCGAGGAGRGLHQAGFDVVAGVDQDKQALQTYNENLSGEPVFHDLADVDTSVLPTADIDYVHGSPPCQGFSQAKGSRDPDDQRNQLVWSFIEWVDELRPQVVTMENVTGMTSITNTFLERVAGEGLTASEQQTLGGDTISETPETNGFGSIGYSTRWKVLNAADYGVPQTRERVFLVAVRDDLESPSEWFPTPTHESSDHVSVADVLEDLAPLAIASKMTDNQNEKHQKEGRRPFSKLDQPAKTVRTGTPPQLIADGSGIRNHVPQDHEDETRRRFATLEPGESGKGISNRRLDPDSPSPTICAGEGAGVPPIHYKGPAFNHEPVDHCESQKEKIRNMDPGHCGDSVTSRRLHPDEPSGTVTISSRTPMAHYREVRRLTARECARLQSFPDTHVFTGGKTDQLKQIGNAVPPKLQYHIGKHVQKILRGAA